ncbi:MAG: hypothetical protein ROO71_12505 [Balneola sp.]
MRITKIQKKELADIVIKEGLNTNLFDTPGENEFFTVKLKNEPFSFTLKKINSDKYRMAIVDIFDLNVRTADVFWEGLVKQFTKWIENVSKELKIKTGWEDEVFDNYLNTEYSYKQLNDLFSEEEKELVRNSINELKGKVITLEIEESSIIAINNKLDDLSEKVDELSRFDWKSMFYGTIINLTMSLSISSEIQSKFMDYVKEAFIFLKKLGS